MKIVTVPFISSRLLRNNNHNNYQTQVGRVMIGWISFRFRRYVVSVWDPMGRLIDCIDRSKKRKWRKKSFRPSIYLLYKATLCNPYSKLLNWMGWDRCQHFSSIFNSKETTGENAALCYMLL